MNSPNQSSRTNSVKITYLKNNHLPSYTIDAQDYKTLVFLDSRAKSTHNKIQLDAPSLIHLSARLQDQNINSRNAKPVKPQSNLFLPISTLTQNKVHGQNGRKKFHISVKHKIRSNIQQYFTSKQNSSKDRNEMKTFLGEISLVSGKKERKIAARIKENIKNLTLSQKPFKKNMEQSIKEQQSKNRVDLQSDFNNFLVNKRRQLKEIKKTTEQAQDLEEKRLKKLSVVNPQDQIVLKSRRQAQFLDLFRFLPSYANTIDPEAEEKAQSRISRKLNTSNNKQRRIHNIFAYYKTEHQQFQWSKIKDKNKRQFTIRNVQN